MTLVLSTLAGAALMFGLPALWASSWNRRRAARARAYRATHRTPWWLPQTGRGSW